MNKMNKQCNKCIHYKICSHERTNNYYNWNVKGYCNCKDFNFDIPRRSYNNNISNCKRLEELIKDVIQIDTWDNGEFIDHDINYEEISDYLLKNGIIVLPCNVGDKVFTINFYRGKYLIEETIVERINYISPGYDSETSIGEFQILTSLRTCDKSSIGKDIISRQFKVYGKDVFTNINDAINKLNKMKVGNSNEK